MQTQMTIPPFDPRDPFVLPVAPPVTVDSVASARAANEADRRRYVLDVARGGAGYGLDAILDNFPQDKRRDVLMALTQYVDLVEEKGPTTMAKTLMAYRLEIGL